MQIRKKTKIVCTIGPATESAEMLEKLINAGMNVMRLNFSHGDFAEHQKKVENLRKAVKKTGKPVAVLQDLGGPKIRIGDFNKEFITLKPGQTFTLTTEKIVGDESRVSVNYAPLPKEVKVGGLIMLHDGKKKLEILDIKGNDVICKVLIGGDIKGRRGVNLPGAYLSIPSLTGKDKQDIEFGLKNKVDFIAFSFVRRPSDVEELRAILARAKSDARIIAKIEDQEAIENIDKLVELVDGVMIGRGDLGIEIGAENLPMVQKMIIAKCNKAGKPVITATHMLESMIKNPVPTRAEVSDIANAILDGTDAIMLSEETTLGDYPVQAVETMTTIAKRVEKEYPYKQVFEILPTQRRTTDAVTASVVATAKDTGAKLIVAATASGYTARMVSRYKPQLPIIGMTASERTRNQLLLSFGVYPIKAQKFRTVPDLMKFVRQFVLKEKLAEKGDKVVIATGFPFNKPSISTNMLLVETV